MIATRDEIPAKPWIDDEPEMYSGWMKMVGESLEDLVAQSKSTGPLGNILALLGSSFLESRARLLVECFDALHAAGVGVPDEPLAGDAASSAILEVAAHARNPMGRAELAPSAESEDEPHPELFAPIPPARLGEDELAHLAEDAFAELAALRKGDDAPHSPSDEAAATSDEEKVRAYWVAIEKWAAEDLARRRVVEHRFDLTESGGGTDDGCFARRRGDEWQFFADARGIFEAFRGAVPNFFGCVLTTSYQIGPVLRGKNVIPGFEARLWPTDVPQELVEKAVAAMAKESISKKRAAEDLARRRVVEHCYDLKESGGTAPTAAARPGEEWQFFANAGGICEAFREAFPDLFGNALKTGAQVRSVLRGEKAIPGFEARLWPTDVPQELVEKAVAAMAKKSKKSKKRKQSKKRKKSKESKDDGEVLRADAAPGADGRRRRAVAPGAAGFE
ncbi:hypothetical protein JL722_11269 [Aureococcus anophagefferens]|nr:hypothetical protein JL722_11269 [Aureococcus anophagefferens]